MVSLTMQAREPGPSTAVSEDAPQATQAPDTGSSQQSLPTHLQNMPKPIQTSSKSRAGWSYILNRPMLKDSSALFWPSRLCSPKSLDPADQGLLIKNINVILHDRLQVKTVLPFSFRLIPGMGLFAQIMTGAL